MLLPIKRSFQWITVLAVVFTVNIFALIISRIVVSSSITTQSLIGFAILSLSLAIIASFGYFRSILFSTVFIIFDVIGIAYMYFVIFTNKSDGWSDLTSIVGFIVIVGFGIIMGIISELISLIVRKNKRKSNKR